jgi:hypothetical protein
VRGVLRCWSLLVVLVALVKADKLDRHHVVNYEAKLLVGG